MINPESSANVALISAVGATCAALISVGLPLLSKRRGQARRYTIESLRHDADQREGSYQRLERENARLAESLDRARRNIADLDTALSIERDLHRKTVERCDEFTIVLRRLGQLPPEEGDDENGRSR